MRGMISKTKTRYLVRGKLWNKEAYFSICSKHFFRDETCNMCKHGLWVNLWKHRFAGILRKIHYKLWLYYIKNYRSVREF